MKGAQVVKPCHSFICTRFTTRRVAIYRFIAILHDPLIARLERNELGSKWEAGQFVPGRRATLTRLEEGRNFEWNETKQLRFRITGSPILLIGSFHSLEEIPRPSFSHPAWLGIEIRGSWMDGKKRFPPITIGTEIERFLDRGDGDERSMSDTNSKLMAMRLDWSLDNNYFELLLLLLERWRSDVFELLFLFSLLFFIFSAHPVCTTYEMVCDAISWPST